MYIVIIIIIEEIQCVWSVLSLVPLGAAESQWLRARVLALESQS